MIEKRMRTFLGEIERAVKSGEITVEEMVEAFRKELQKSFGK